MIHLEFVFLKALTMLLGLIVALAAYRGYRRYRSRPLGYVAVGFLLLSIGAGLEGVLFDFTPLTLYQASLVHTVFMIAGMGFILYSIYGGAISTAESAETDIDHG